MHRLPRALLPIAVALLASSCSDSDARSATQPSFVGGSFVVVTATSSTAVAQPVNNPFCPTIAPFNVPLGVIVRPTASSTVVVTGIRSQFTDTSGLQAPQVTPSMPQVTLPMPLVPSPAPGPTMTFGTPTQAGSEFTFPFTLGIGCGTGTQGTVIIIVETSDDHGRRRSDQVSVAVR